MCPISPDEETMAVTLSARAEATLRSVLEELEGPILVVDPSAEIIEGIVEAAGELEDPPTLRVIAEEATLKGLMHDFLVSSKAADLVDAGVLEIRSATPDPGTELFLTTDRVTALVRAQGALAALSTEEDGFVSRANDVYTEVWDGATPFDLRTPGLTRVRETLRAEIGPAAADDFDAVLASLETARGDGDGLDEVTISLLVAAKNQELLYDISKWGENIGIASKATFSRTKTHLEDLGIIDTEKVPIDVGRPRLRLKFGHEKLRTVTNDELASMAQSLMA